jgi:hypothetical protein
MAQTKRKRRTKHRGNAAGVVEVRGRTGRKPGPEDRKTAAKGDPRARREMRLATPPTWRGALNRAALAAGVFFVIVLLLFKQPLAGAVALAGFTFLLYVPLGYYIDLILHRRYLAKRRSG